MLADRHFGNEPNVYIYIYVYIGYSGNSTTDLCDKSRVLIVLMFGDASVWYDARPFNFYTSHVLFHCSHSVPIATRIGARLCTGGGGEGGGVGGRGGKCRKNTTCFV